MYGFVRGLCKFLVWIAFRFQVEDLPEIPEGKLILCANHTNIVDPVVLIASFPGQVIFVAKKELERMPVLSRIFKKIGTIFVDRSANDIDAIRQMSNTLKADKVLGIFPEGHRYKTVDPSHIKSGIGFLAMQAGSDILCATIDANYRFRGKVSVQYHPILSFDAYRKLSKREARMVITRDVFNTIFHTEYSTEDFS